MYRVSIVKAGDDLKRSVSLAIEKIGGISRFVSRGEVVLLKPNYNSADPFPASTDYPFLKAVVELFYDAGAKLVVVADSSMYVLNTKKIFKKRGVLDLEQEKLPARVYSFDEGEWIKKEIKNGTFLTHASIPKLLDEVDRVVFLPCLKTHFKGQFTGALKLSMGCLKSAERIGFHISGLQEKVAELSSVVRVDLSIMDARKCFISGGPFSGTLREPGLILASDDRVAMDVEGIKIIKTYDGNSLAGIDPWQLPQVKHAVALGIGSKSEKEYSIEVGE